MREKGWKNGVKSRDSRRKDELITGCQILKNIYQRQNKMGGEVNGKMLKKR